MKAETPILIIYQQTLGKTTFWHQCLAGIAGWLWTIPQAEQTFLIY